MIVELTLDDLERATEVALRQVQNRFKYNRKRDHGSYRKRRLSDRMGSGVIGFLGEIAASRALGLEWTPGGDEVTSGDLENSIEVRTTEHENGHLIVYPNDNLDTWYVLVVVDELSCRVIGTFYGRNAIQDKYYLKDKKSYWVPQQDLQRVEFLRRNTAA